MRTSNRLVLGTALLGLIAASVASCGPTESTCAERGDCRNPCDDPAYAEKYPAACPDAGTGGTGGTAGEAGSAGDAGDEDVSTGGTGGTGGEAGAGGQDAGDAEAGGSGGEDGGDAEAEPYCDPTSSPDEDPCVIHDELGIFVSPSGNDAAGCGTMAAPCATVARGLIEAKSAGKRLYACGDGGSYDEALTIDASLDGLSVFGGFRCSDWSYAPSAVRTQVKPAGAQTAIVVEAVTALEMRDFAFESGDASDPGASSIAALVRNASGVVFLNTTFKAGNGAEGTDGTDGSPGEQVPVVTPAQAGLPSTCGSTTPNGGGAWLSSHQCAAGGSTRGGAGGTAKYEQPGDPGLDGTETTNIQTAGMGEGGPGGTVGDKAGKQGEPGSAGNPGDNGTAAASEGTLSESGYTPANGADGTNGWPGQGGGGSGASWSDTGCVGPSGGAGGLGGCGGFAGTKGTGGGASIGLLVWQSGVTLEDCSVSSGAGGKGGDGGAGGAASLGRPGADGGNDGYGTMADSGKAGTGGNGGPGGSGSGGTGGPSYAIAVHGNPPTEVGTVAKSPGTGGPAGTGGQATGGDKAPDGSDGASAEVVSI